MAIKQSDINIIPQRDRDIVFSFVRDAQNILPFEENSYYNIPPLIVHMILIFFHIGEMFDKNACSDNILMNDDCDEIESTEGLQQATGTVYGAFEIHGRYKCKYEWIFEIIDHKNVIGIGIDSSNKEYINDVFHDNKRNKHSFYACQILIGNTNAVGREM